MSLSNDAKPENYAVNARICQLVAQCPFMYDRSHPQYLKKDVCDEAWSRIAKEMDESVSTCRERWRNIRTSFARSINTNKVACRANRTKPYYLHEELKFLLDYITPGIPVTKRYKKKTTSTGESGGEESELIEVSVGEETFNGFEHLSCSYGENGDLTQHENENDWQQRQTVTQNCKTTEANGTENENSNENESCDSSLAEERISNKLTQQEHEDPNNSTRLAQLPPPPLQAAPLSAFQRGTDETEAAAALQQIQMSTMPKRTRLETNTSNAASDTSAIHFLAEQQRRVSRCGGNNVADGSGRVELIGTLNSTTPETNGDTVFLQELQNEMRSMDRRQKIHLKRRVYEALAEIFPMNTNSNMPIAINVDNTTGNTATAPLVVDMPRPIFVAKPQTLLNNSSNVSTQVSRHDLNTWQQKRPRNELHINGLNDVTVISETPAQSTKRQKNLSRSTLNESSVAITRSATAERRRPFNHSQQSQQSTQSVKDEPDGAHYSE